MKCPLCGSEYQLTEAEKDFLKHSVMLTEILKRLDNLERKITESEKK